MRAAELIAEDGSFDGFDGTVPFDELNAFFRRRPQGAVRVSEPVGLDAAAPAGAAAA